MTQTRVVHVNSPEWAQAVKDGTAVYIGRANPRRGFKASKWANPFKIGPDGTRASAIEGFRLYLRGRLDLVMSIEELDGKVLGCWCKPDACHGDVLVELLQWTCRCE